MLKKLCSEYFLEHSRAGCSTSVGWQCVPCSRSGMWGTFSKPWFAAV